jgi:M6 family metalloprotease-like protein
MVLFSGAFAEAVMVTPGAEDRLISNNKIDYFTSLMLDARARGMNVPRQFEGGARLGGEDRRVDTARILVLLVDFEDNAYAGGDVAAAASSFDSILFSTGGRNPTGSMTEYYLENSLGGLMVLGEVRGWYRMPRTYASYVNDNFGIGRFFPMNSKGLAFDAVKVADSLGVDFSVYDHYGDPSGGADGEIDGLMIVHAGLGAEQTGLSSEMISHKWDLGPYATIMDGISIDAYAILPEEYLSAGHVGVISPIGAFCHEFGHLLGLPDLYDIDYKPSGSDGIGVWSLMARGSYKGDSKVPAHLDAWSKIRLGFVTPVDVRTNLENASIPQIESEPVIYRLWRDGVYSGPEYFLVENRQPIGFDRGLPGSGIIIYHVDDTASFDNIDVDHYHVAVEQADGLFQLEHTVGNCGDGGDPWPGNTARRSFDDLSFPSSRGYGDMQTEVSVWNISDSDSLMTANFDVNWSRPYFRIEKAAFCDSDGDDVIEAGEVIRFYFEIRNLWLAADDVIVSMSSNDSSLGFFKPSAVIDELNGDGSLGGNYEKPIAFKVPDTLIPTFDTFLVHIESNGREFDSVYSMERQVGRSQVLIVDDDRGKPYESTFIDDLYRKRIPCEVWDKRHSGSPSGGDLSRFYIVIWFTGDTACDLLQPADIEAMKRYLKGGGNLFLSGQGLVGELQADNYAFLKDYLHAEPADEAFYFVHEGIEGSPIGQGLEVRYESSTDQAFKPTQQLVCAGGAQPAFRFKNTTAYSALSYSGDYRLVFFNFGYEALSNDFPDYDKRDTVLFNIFEFFKGLKAEIAGAREPMMLAEDFVLGQNYPNPFNLNTKISYTLRPSRDGRNPRTELKVYNILGQVVKVLFDGLQLPGSYSAVWDGTDLSGRPVASGFYLYQLVRGDQEVTRKMILLK